MGNKKGSLSITSENIFPVIKKWLYSDHDIFYRELISNGCDAITKLKKLDMMGEYSLPLDYKAKKAVVTTSVIQYQGREFTEAECLKKAQAQFKKDYKKEVLEEINIYIKPEENKIYYVANKDRVGSVDL